jgi:hypothetical protein
VVSTVPEAERVVGCLVSLAAGVPPRGDDLAMEVTRPACKDAHVCNYMDFLEARVKDLEAQLAAALGEKANAVATTPTTKAAFTPPRNPAAEPIVASPVPPAEADAPPALPAALPAALPEAPPAAPPTAAPALPTAAAAPPAVAVKAADELDKLHENSVQESFLECSVSNAPQPLDDVGMCTVIKVRPTAPAPTHDAWTAPHSIHVKPA